jgi:hypothetical protein
MVDHREDRRGAGWRLVPSERYAKARSSKEIERTVTPITKLTDSAF